jgi:hypothetical protein
MSKSKTQAESTYVDVSISFFKLRTRSTQALLEDSDARPARMTTSAVMISDKRVDKIDICNQIITPCLAAQPSARYDE